MTSTLTVRGIVRDSSSESLITSGLVCLTNAHQLVAQSTIGEEGSYELSSAEIEPGTYLLTVLASGLEGWRRAIEVGDFPTEEAIGTIDLDDTEYPPGLYGQLWDELRDQPIFAGRVRLEQAGETIAEDALDPNGMFSIEMTCSRPLPPGEYELVSVAPGYEDARVTLQLGEEAQAHQLGRVELSAIQENQAGADD